MTLYSAGPGSKAGRRWLGARAYDVLWRSLFHFKFYELQDSLSAAWLGTRIKRVALSRRSLFQEELGYIEGGSEVLLLAVARRIEELGGAICLRAGVEQVVIEGDEGAAGAQGAGSLRVTGVRVDGVSLPFDARIVGSIVDDV